MDNIFATYTAQMTHDFFMEMVEMLAKCNPQRLIEITNTGLKLSGFNTGPTVYYFTGTFGTLMQVGREPWETELRAYEHDVRKAADRGTIPA